MCISLTPPSKPFFWRRQCVSPEWLLMTSVFPCSAERMLNTSLLFKDLIFLKKEPNPYIIFIFKSHQSLK